MFYTEITDWIMQKAKTCLEHCLLTIYKQAVMLKNGKKQHQQQSSIQEMREREREKKEEKKRETDGQTDRQTDGQTDKRQTLRVGGD